MTPRIPLLPGVLGLAALTVGFVMLTARVALTPAPTDTHRATGTDAVEDVADSSASFSLPSGKPAALTCEQARRIVVQIHSTLAYVPGGVSTAALATATADWLDPFGIWSAAPDSPIPALVARQAGNLLRELEDTDPASCSAAHEVSDALLRWTRDLRARFDRSREAAMHAPIAPSAASATAAAEDPLFEEVRPAHEVATHLGARIGRLERELGADLSPYGDVARERFFPPFTSEGWADVVRAAAVRAYLPLLDPHGLWAPLGEEASIYDVDLDPRPPESLWEGAVRTAIGVLVESGPLAPLDVGDVVLSIAGVPTIGLAPEQLDQLVYVATDSPTAEPLVVLRHGTHELRTLSLAPPEDAQETDAPAHSLTTYRVGYGDGDVVIVEIHEVRSDLGDELARALRRERELGQRALQGVLLDLRGNGGGAADGAIAVLGLFLPGAPLFPMAHHDGTIEVDRAPEPPFGDRWLRPVAALVDRDTASAAEMIAGALLAYRRGPVVGERTFGKGCAQEYVDDEAGVGVLRLTTLLYALPDGSPVQQIGIEPSLLLASLAASQTPRQREGDEPNAPPTWRGPDVRDPTVVVAPMDDGGWPEHHGNIGPAHDATVEAALRGMGVGTTSASRRSTLTRQGEPVARALPRAHTGPIVAHP